MTSHEAAALVAAIEEQAHDVVFGFGRCPACRHPGPISTLANHHVTCPFAPLLLLAFNRES